MTDERLELLEIARALRAHAELQLATGATGLPKGESRPELEPLPPPQPVAAAPPPMAVPAPVPPPAFPPPRPFVLEPPKPSPAPSSRPALRVPVPEIPADPQRRLARLVELSQSIRDCQRCVLHAQRTQTVFARGNPQAELCFVGEGPGADEDLQGFPFVGKAGQLLDRMIAAMGFDREEVYVCNIVKCRPPGNRKPLPEEMAACEPYLTEQLALVGPKVIVALGATAAEGLLGQLPGGITRTRGQWRLYNRTIPVMPTFHPAYLLRNPSAKRLVWEDLKAVAERLGRPVVQARKHE